MKKTNVFMSFLIAAVFLCLSVSPAPVSAVTVFDKEVGGEKLKLTLFGFSQLTAESGDGLTTQTGKDDGLRFSADRIRIGYKVKWAKVFSKLQIDFNRDHSKAKTAGMPEIIKDAEVGYKFSKAVSIKTGIFKTPVGMDFNNSGKKLDITKRGMEKSLVLERSLGLMVSGRKIGGTGLGYDIGYFNPTTRSSVVSDGTAGDQAAWAGRIHYDMGKTLHAEVSYGVSDEASGVATSDDYKVWDAAVSYKIDKLTLKAEYIDGTSLKGAKDEDQTVWYLHAGYRITPMLEAVVRHYQGDEDSSGTTASTDLSNTVIGLNVFLIPEKKEGARLQLNYVMAGGDEWKWGGSGGYKDDVVLAQFQVSF